MDGLSRLLLEVLLLHELLFLLLLLLLLCQLLLLLGLLLGLGELGCLELQLGHACPVCFLEDVLVFHSPGLKICLLGLHLCLDPVVALLAHGFLLLDQLEALRLQLEALFFQRLLDSGRSPHAVEDHWRPLWGRRLHRGIETGPVACYHGRLEGLAEMERLCGSWRRRWLRLRYQRCQGGSLAR